jgi:hypothetical protein
MRLMHTTSSNQEVTVLVHRPISRAAALCVIACALLGPMFSGTALATNRVSAARAQGLYYASFRNDEATIDKAAAARTQGTYYASFRNEGSLAPPPAPASRPTWALLVAGLAIALIIVVAVTAEVHRLGVRRRAARVSTSA